eukprot:CAMPEP_0175132924 /NCGR_PEP_ID=MMETSP0087-20121206/7342_1 /TAXON_ID=136419 /ORGANISM="Unknown Unknown, Strain D1" /LENGTH=405 /DNA_ID=CAMNT_0016415327 /DNA_START=67 /DNA_END=1284 /DNA_ORIENTATION=+
MPSFNHYSHACALVLVALLTVPFATGTSCSADGGTGMCIDTSKQSCSDGILVKNHCPGGANIECCLTRWGNCAVESYPGVCELDSVCQGTALAGFCPGPSSVQCCVQGCPQECGNCVAKGGGAQCAPLCTNCPSQCQPCLKDGGGLECMKHCTNIPTQARAFLDKYSALAHNTYTILLQNRWGNLTYYEHEPDHPRIPASNTKIWTTSCAYDQIGWNTKWPWDNDHTIQQACVDILKPSWNEGADHLLSFIGEKLAHTSDQQQAADWVLKWVKQRVGLNMSGAAMGDGCGLDRANHFSARQINGMVRWMLDHFTGWEPALPVGCVDGTLVHRFCGEDGKGRVHAKTGTLHDVHAISGYVHNRHDDQIYLFSVLTNNAPDDAATESVETIDAIAILMGQKGIPNPV